MRKILVALVVLPLVALAQGPQQHGPGMGPGPGAGPGPGPGAGPGAGAGQRMEPIQHRMRLARTLGLAEVLDLNDAQALKMRDVLARFDDKRIAAFKQLRDAHDVLRRAAQGEQVAPAQIDQAIQRGLDARAQIQAIDRDTVQAVLKELPTPEKRARAVLFLERFHQRFGRAAGMGMGAGMGPHGRGMGGHGMGQGQGMGMGPGAGQGMGAGACPNCPYHDDDEDDGQ